MGRGASRTVGRKRKKMLRLEAGHFLLVRQKVIVAMHEHETREVPHEWLLLHVEVPDHIRTASAAN